MFLVKDDLKKVDKDLGMLETVLNGKDDKDVDLNTLLKVLEQDDDKRNQTMHRFRRQLTCKSRSNFTRENLFWMDVTYQI